MNRYFLLPLLVVALLTKTSTEHNILGLFPHFGFSHFKVFYPVLRGLAESGHNVTVITYIKSPEPHPNYHEMIIKGENTINVFTLDLFTVSRALPVLFNEYFLLHNEGQESCEKFYQSGFVEEIQKRHASVPYDLVIAEFFNTDCYMGLPYMLKLPVVGLSSCALMPWFYDRILLPDTPSHIQSEFIGFPEVLNWQERLVNFVQAKAIKWLYRYHTNYKDKQIIQKYLKIDVDVNEFAKASTSLIFVNQHYSLSGSRPQTPQLIEMGGIHIDEQQINATLPEKLENFLRQSPNGVLFISWGSMLRGSSFPEAKLQAILKILLKLQLRVVWKWEAEKIPTDSEQFLFAKWAPQLTLLCHPKVKLFWGHGGLLGATEAVHCGKPLILTPIYGDQFLNANAVENRKIGKIMHFNEIEERHLENVIQEVLRPRYSENARALSAVFRNREMAPLKKVLWWIEHLLSPHGRTASEVLRTKAVQLHWFVYYSLDSVALLLTAVASLLLALFWLLRVACKLRKHNSKVKKS